MSETRFNNAVEEAREALTRQEWRLEANAELEKWERWERWERELDDGGNQG